MIYLIAFAVALAVDTVPVFAPPAWMILAFMIVKWKPNPWAIIAAGALGSVIGRYVLTLYMPHVSSKIFRPKENKNIRFLGNKLGGNFWHVNLFVMLYAISPLSTTALFTAGGMAQVNPWNMLPGFAIGKFLGDAWVIYTAKVTADDAQGLLHGHVSWQTLVTAGFGVLILGAVLFVDWHEALEHKKLKLDFAIWKR